MSIYYVDPINGNDESLGTSPSLPKKNAASVLLKAGDSLLFKRGSFVRGALAIVGGDNGAPIRYGAYGEGEMPIFCGSVDVSSCECWEQTEQKNIWRCVKTIDGDVGNFVLDGKCSATLRWTREELISNGDFFDSRFSEGEQNHRNYSEQEILFYCDDAPYRKYDSIECVSFATRELGKIRSNVIIEDICFMNSGVHALAGAGKNVTVRRCSFKNIGGCAWNRELKIRFGNGVEFWNYAEDVTVEECSFENVYDSCVTHQGGGEGLLPAKNFICRKNRFDTYGMAALELRDIVATGFFFLDNECKNAGCGFAMLGESLPRRSEIWPQPMGHHVFLWRMEKSTENGRVEIRNNIFGMAPVGAAIYSIIAPEAEAQFVIDGNFYTPNDSLLVRFGGKCYNSLHAFCEETEREENGKYLL